MEYNIIKEPNIIKVLWKLSYACNYNCPYCIQHTASELTFSKSYSNQSDIEDRARIISSKLSDEQRARTMFVLSGGECTLFDLGRIIKILNVPKIRIITNGSRDIDYYVNLKNICDSLNIDLSISMSIHKSQQSLYSYTDKIKALHNMHIKCSCSLVISDESDINWIKSQDFRVNPVIAKFAQVDGGGPMYPNLLDIEKKVFPNEVNFQLRDKYLKGYNCVGTITIDTSGKWRYGSYCKPWQDSSSLKDLSELDFSNFYKEIKCTSKYKCNISCGIYRIYNDNTESEPN